MQNILIAIQARSGSTRLPRKAFELIGEKRLLDHVIDACKNAAIHVRKTPGIMVRVAVLTPTNDPIVKEFKNLCPIVEGPEADVLGRYILAANLFKPDYIVRITGDCPLIPGFIISKAITLARMNEYDYVSNVHPKFRTALDGADCEVMSHKLLTWLNLAAKDASDREHVTTYARSNPPEWAKIGCMVGHFDHSDIKLSVDTAEDLKRARAAYDAADEKYRAAVRLYGQHQVHRV